jgi:hypothetical protein
MSCELAQTLQAALDDGCSLSDLEATFLARGDTDDRIAAAWLYAWAYDALRPRRDDLAERVSRGRTRDQARQGAHDPGCRERPLRHRGTLTARSGDRRDCRGSLELNTAPRHDIGADDRRA